VETESVSDLESPMASEARRPAAHVPIWNIALLAVLFAIGIARHRAGAISTKTRLGEEHATRPGRLAATPSQIHARGWKDILLRVARSLTQDRLLLVAAGVTFYGLLSVFPGIAALISVYGLFGNPASVAGRLDMIANIAPGGAMDVLRDQMTRLAAQGGTTLGVSFFVGLMISLWTANSGIKAIFDALNFVYDKQEERGFFQLNAVSLLFTVGIVVFVLLIFGGVIALPVIVNYIAPPVSTATLFQFGRWPILFVLVTSALEILYKFGPSREERRWRWVSWGSIFAAIVWLATSVLFSWYVANFGSYNKTYGSLGAIIGFMTWIWISVIVILVGAKLNAEIAHRSARGGPWSKWAVRTTDTVGATGVGPT
jgi:membrane protein